MKRETTHTPLTRDPPGASPGLEKQMDTAPPTPTTSHSLINDATQAITDLDEASERMRAIIRNAIPVGYPRHDVLAMLETATGLVMTELQRLSKQYAAMGYPPAPRSQEPEDLGSGLPMSRTEALARGIY